MAASLLISARSFSSLIWSLIVMIFVIFKRIFSKPLRDASIVSITKKKKKITSAFSVNINEIFSGNIWWMIYRNLLKFSFIQKFGKKKWVVCSLRSFGTLKYDCVIKIREIFNFLPLKNNSVTTEFSFVLLIIPAIISSKTIIT